MDELYINRKAAMLALMCEADAHLNPVKRAYTRATAIIGQIAVEDVQPVKHGYWEEITDYGGWGDTRYRCSVCGEEWYLENGKPKDNNMNFCPRCGARMEMMNNGKM